MAVMHLHSFDQSDLPKPGREGKTWRRLRRDESGEAIPTYMTVGSEESGLVKGLSRLRFCRRAEG